MDKLDALLARSFTPRQDAALIAEMMSRPNDGRYPTLELAALQRRHKTLEALTAQLEALSRSNPVLMMFEDVHWSDPTSLEALGRTVDRLRTLEVLLIITYRPLYEERNTISALHYVVANVFRKRVIGSNAMYKSNAFALAETIEADCCYVGRSDPRRLAPGNSAPP